MSRLMNPRSPMWPVAPEARLSVLKISPSLTGSPATVDQLLESLLNLFDGSPNSSELYHTHARHQVSPLLG